MQATTAEQYGLLSRFLPINQEKPPAVSAPDTNLLPFRVLIMEASIPLGRLLATGLLADHLSVEVTHDLISLRQDFQQDPADLLILDVDSPGMDSPALLRELRARHPEVRILALSAQSGVESMVSALDNGADDYLQKPFSLLEMMARVRALRRRSQTATPSSAAKSATLILHREHCCVERDGRQIELTPREFTLLECLMQNTGKTLSRAVLAQKVWNMAAEGSTNIVDVYIKYLRDKLDGDNDVKLIRTVRGMGYSYHAQS